MNVGSGGGAAAAAAPSAGGAAAAGGSAEEAAPEAAKEEGKRYLLYGHRSGGTLTVHREGGVRRGHGFRSFRLSARSQRLEKSLCHAIIEVMGKDVMDSSHVTVACRKIMNMCKARKLHDMSYVSINSHDSFNVLCWVSNPMSCVFRMLCYKTGAFTHLRLYLLVTVSALPLSISLG